MTDALGRLLGLIDAHTCRLGKEPTSLAISRVLFDEVLTDEIKKVGQYGLNPARAAETSRALRQIQIDPWNNPLKVRGVDVFPDDI